MGKLCFSEGDQVRFVGVVWRVPGTIVITAERLASGQPMVLGRRGRQIGEITVSE
jgi:hypothetical protein